MSPADLPPGLRPLAWSVELPLDYAADPPTMERMVTRWRPRAEASWLRPYDPATVTVVWGVKAHPSREDRETGMVRTAEWDPETPIPAWAHKLLLAFVAQPTLPRAD